MPLTAIYLLPLPSNQPSPLPTILSHITLTHPCTLLPPFTLTHHLHASTSSLLPSPTPWPPAPYNRPYLSILTLSPQQHDQTSPPSFLTTSHPNPIPDGIESPGAPPILDRPAGDEIKKLAQAEQRAIQTYERAKTAYDAKLQSCLTTALSALTYSVTSVTIPSAETGVFLDMLNSKMGPLWAHRGTERVVEGTSIGLREGEWVLRVGELRQESRKGGAVSTALRAVLFEITWVSANGKVGEQLSKEAEGDVKAFLDRLLEGTGVKLDAARSVAGCTPASSEETNWVLAELYTELLRSRG